MAIRRIDMSDMLSHPSGVHFSSAFETFAVEASPTRMLSNTRADMDTRAIFSRIISSTT